MSSLLVSQASEFGDWAEEGGAEVQGYAYVRRMSLVDGGRRRRESSGVACCRNQSGEPISAGVGGNFTSEASALELLGGKLTCHYLISAFCFICFQYA